MTIQPDGRAPRAARRRIDWRKAAELVADGKPIEELVGQSGARAASCRAGATTIRSFGAGSTVQNRSARAAARPPRRARPRRPSGDRGRGQENNVRVLLWLADRLKLITPPNERTSEQELREILGGLSSDELSEFESLREAS